MKTISDQLYGYKSEMGATSETNGTTCFCVDDGLTYVAFNGTWFCQAVPWCTRVPGENDLGGYSYYLPSAEALDDLTMFCAYDSGARYISYNGHWYRQPVPWAAADSSGGGGEGGPSIYDEDDLIIRMDYYYDEVAEKYALLSITPSLADIGERITSDSPIGLERLIATRWDSAEKEFLGDRMVYDHVNFDSYESGEDTFCTLEGSFSGTIFPGESSGFFDYYHIQYSEETDEVTMTYTSYAVDITEDT